MKTASKLALFLSCGLGATLGGCDADCENPKRIDGHYAVWSNVVTHTPADPPEDYPADEIFYNGWSEWSLNYVPAHSNFDLDLDAQQYTAAFISSDNSCNRFNLEFSGTYISATAGVRHDFSWAGDLMYLGSHLNGTFNYTATWQDPETGASGSVDTSGELSGTAVTGDNFDTGF